MKMTSAERKASKTKRATEDRRLVGAKAAGKLAVKVAASRVARPLLVRFGSRIVVKIGKRLLVRFLTSRMISQAKSAIIRTVAAKALVILGGKILTGKPKRLVRTM